MNRFPPIIAADADDPEADTLLRGVVIRQTITVEHSDAEQPNRAPFEVGARLRAFLVTRGAISRTRIFRVVAAERISDTRYLYEIEED